MRGSGLKEPYYRRRRRKVTPLPSIKMTVAGSGAINAPDLTLIRSSMAWSSRLGSAEPI